MVKPQKVSLISNISRHSKKLKEQRDQENKGDSSNVTYVTEASQRGKGPLQTKVSLARKVSSKKSTAIGTGMPVTGNTSTTNAARQHDPFIVAPTEVIAQRRSSAAAANPVLGKVPARKIKAKIVKQPED